MSLSTKRKFYTYMCWDLGACVSQNESHYDIAITRLCVMGNVCSISYFFLLFFSNLTGFAANNSCSFLGSVRCCARFVSVYGYTGFICASEAGGSTTLGLGI